MGGELGQFLGKVQSRIGKKLGVHYKTEPFWAAGRAIVSLGFLLLRTGIFEAGPCGLMVWGFMPHGVAVVVHEAVPEFLRLFQSTKKATHEQVKGHSRSCLSILTTELTPPSYCN